MKACWFTVAAWVIMSVIFGIVAKECTLRDRKSAYSAEVNALGASLNSWLAGGVLLLCISDIDIYSLEALDAYSELAMFGISGIILCFNIVVAVVDDNLRAIFLVLAVIACIITIYFGKALGGKYDEGIVDGYTVETWSNVIRIKEWI